MYSELINHITEYSVSTGCWHWINWWIRVYPVSDQLLLRIVQHYLRGRHVLEYSTIVNKHWHTSKRPELETRLSRIFAYLTAADRIVYSLLSGGATSRFSDTGRRIQALHSYMDCYLQSLDKRIGTLDELYASTRKKLQLLQRLRAEQPSILYFASLIPSLQVQCCMLIGVTLFLIYLLFMDWNILCISISACIVYLAVSWTTIAKIFYPVYARMYIELAYYYERLQQQQHIIQVAICTYQEHSATRTTT